MIGKTSKILALISVVVIAALTLVGKQIEAVFNNIGEKLKGVTKVN
ncbi:Flp family type IVb pilin [Helcococcus ovis]